MTKISNKSVSPNLESKEPSKRTKLPKLPKLPKGWRISLPLPFLVVTVLPKQSGAFRKSKVYKAFKESNIYKAFKKSKKSKVSKVSKVSKKSKASKVSKKSKSGTKNSKKKSFLIRSLEKSSYDKMKLMNTTDEFIKKWQLQRIILSLIAAIVGDFLIICVFKQPLIFALSGPVIGLILYGLKHVNVNQQYKVYKFNRNLEFSKFARLIVPYLRQAKNGTSIYHIFNQMVNRMENPIDRQLMQKLMIQITDYPTEMWPYIDFAKKMSGTDFSITFMTLIYDISQGATDDNIIDELGKEVSQQLMDIISDIIEFKEKKFMMFPTMIVAPNMVLILGYMACIMIYQFSKLGF